MSIGKFVLNVIVAFIAFGALYTAGGLLIADQMEAMIAAFHPEEEIFIATMSYHLVQTVVFVWLFDKAVGSGNLKDGAMFGLMVGLYLMASDAIWFTGLKDFPGDARIGLAVLNIVIGGIIGVLLAFMHGKGWGSSSADSAAE